MACLKSFHSVCMRLSVGQSLCLFVSISVCLCVCACLCASVSLCLSVTHCACVCVCLFASVLCMHLCVTMMSVCLPVFICVCGVCICVQVYTEAKRGWQCSHKHTRLLLSLSRQGVQLNQELTIYSQIGCQTTSPSHPPVFPLFPPLKFWG